MLLNKKLLCMQYYVLLCQEHVDLKVPLVRYLESATFTRYTHTIINKTAIICAAERLDVGHKLSPVGNSSTTSRFLTFEPNCDLYLTESC